MGKLNLEKNFVNKLENIVKKKEVSVNNETKSNSNEIKYNNIKHSYTPKIQNKIQKENIITTNSNYIGDLQKNIIINLNYNTYIEFVILGMIIGLGFTLGLKLGDLIFF